MRLRGTLLVSALALTVAAPAAADWLVTHDGDAIETAGAWEVRGPLVVFEQTDGKLASIRLSEVDLEASRARTLEPAEPVERAQPKRPVVLVLTDADVGHVKPEAPSPPMDDEESTEVEPEEQAAEAPGRLEVTGWRDQVNVDAGVLEVTGSVANRGTSVVTNAHVEVRLLDESGGLIEHRSAAISKNVLGPGSTSPFTATFPGSPGYASVEFEVQGRGFKVRPPAAATEGSPY